MLTNPNDVVTACTVGPNDEQVEGGLTKRELFTYGALKGLLANPEYNTYSNKSLSESAVELADALIEALNKPTP